ncbi:MAG TPA: ABC transporter substrate-binding protein [Oscillospiraceae bacterium]|nr:ABC transporter substrate-binding protein [Oscillospiraceae bacterium]HNW04114.1 ABC transporter substrate-binding protein [Oscillospiraceae bacterium]
MKKILPFLLAALLTLSGCSGVEKIKEFFGGGAESGAESSGISSEPESEPDPDWPAQVSGVTLEAAPGKAISMSPIVTELLYDMGLGDRLAAVSNYCTDDAGNDPSLPDVGTAVLPDLAAIAEIQPDYVLTMAQFSESDLLALQQMDAEVIVFSAPQDLAGQEALRKELSVLFLGKESGASAAADFTAAYEAKLREVTAPAAEYFAANGSTVGVACLRILNSTYATGDTLVNEYLEAAGLTNAAAEYAGWEIGEDGVAAVNPDVLFVSEGICIADLETSDLYKKKTAVKGDKVHAVDLDLLSRGTLRSLEVLRAMLATVAPEAYPDLTPLPPAYPSIYQAK